MAAVFRVTDSETAIRAQLAETSLIDWKRPYREALVHEWLPTRLGKGTVTVAVKASFRRSPTMKFRCSQSPVVGFAERCRPTSRLMLQAENFALAFMTTHMARLGIRRLLGTRQRMIRITGKQQANAADHIVKRSSLTLVVAMFSHRIKIMLC